MKRLLVANRGEIALRIFATCRRLGIETVAISSAEEVNPPHAEAADFHERLGNGFSLSYLSPSAIVAAALRSGADAVHPGYGFLAESPIFAREVANAGLIFVGPTPETMEKFGEKHAARILARSLGVPVAPGYDDADQSEGRILSEGRTLGFPLMIKAVAGGGGRGMRVVTSDAELPEALAAAKREAKAGFGDDRVLLERFIPKARHIEVQLLGDGRGGVIHLFERDCSAQRRNQKVIEEAPAPGLTKKKRKALHDAALLLGRAVSLRNATTVEFLVFNDGDYGVPEGFIFLEANCRLQVEHPVTEQILGCDLVEQQLLIADGGELLKQTDIHECGAAIEVRVYAEDPAHGFAPTGGTISRLQFSSAPSIRNEHALRSGLEVSTAFDPMLAKVIAGGEDREEARKNLIGALAETQIDGFAQNLGFLSALLKTPEFIAGAFPTGFIPELLKRRATELEETKDRILGIYFAALFHRLPLSPVRSSRKLPPRFDPFALRGKFLLESEGIEGPGERALRPESSFTIRDLNFGSEEVVQATLKDVARTDLCRQTLLLDVGGRRIATIAERFNSFGTPTSIRIGDRVIEAAVEFRGDSSLAYPAARIVCFGSLYEVSGLMPKRVRSADEGTPDSAVVSPLPGCILSIRVKVGDAVSRGEVLATLESMKMEHGILASADGVVREIKVSSGESVRAGDAVIVLHEV